MYATRDVSKDKIDANLQGYNTPIASDHQPIKIILKISGKEVIEKKSKVSNVQQYALSENLH
jgi:hypothetical protein